MKSFVLGFTGSSGSGKSTLLKFIKENYEDSITSIELSARPFLQKNGQSYDQQMNDSIQSKILLNNTDYTHRYLESSISLYKKYALSRTPIDVLAYARVLNHAKDFENQQIDLIKYLADSEFYFYTYCVSDFELKEKDAVRGNNEEIRQATNLEIKNILTDLEIPHFTLKGPLEQREENLKLIIEFLERKKRQFKEPEYNRVKELNLNRLLITNNR